MDARRSHEANTWSGSLSLSPGMVIYAGPGGSAVKHSHHAIQLIRSFDSPFQLNLEGRTRTCSAALVPSGVSHSFECSAEHVLLALIEPLGPNGSELNRIAVEAAGASLDFLPPARIDQMANPQLAVQGVVDTLSSNTRIEMAAELSPHVVSALLYLDGAIDGKPRIKEAASAAGISPSRLTHLFTQQVGIPFRKFVLWLRLRRVVESVSQGENLTSSAHSAGFSDSSHLSRVFRENFGLSPSALTSMNISPDPWPV